jgi:Protein of unknown function (DUF3833)
VPRVAGLRRPALGGSRHGIFTDRAGRVVRRCNVSMNCHWNGDTGVFDERFTYSDGSRQRVWTLKKLSGGRYTGTDDDVVGIAVGQSAGNALRWTHTLRLPVDSSDDDVEFDDWMVLMDSRTMLNKVVMSKFGIRLGEVTLAFHKP